MEAFRQYSLQNIEFMLRLAGGEWVDSRLKNKTVAKRLGKILKKCLPLRNSSLGLRVEMMGRNHSWR